MEVETCTLFIRTIKIGCGAASVCEVKQSMQGLKGAKLRESSASLLFHIELSELSVMLYAE